MIPSLILRPRLPYAVGTGLSRPSADDCRLHPLCLRAISQSITRAEPPN